MPAYDSYGTPVSYFNPALLGSGKYTAHGEKWGGPLGTGVTLTFSFPSGTTYAAAGYTEFQPYQWYGLTSLEQSAVRLGLSVWSRYASVSFVEVGDDLNVGEMRFAFSHTLDSGTAAHAYYPYQNAWAGDVWFNPDNFNSDGGSVPVGSYDFLTIIHEVGHALGLKHTFEGTYRPTHAQENYLWSIMSYTASPWSAQGDNHASFYPTTPMYLDLVAIRAMYGARAFNAGNSTYTFTDGSRYWQAIYDTGGTDTIIYNGAENSTISLIQGTFSAVSERIFFSSNRATRSTVSIGPSTVIENAVGGSGHDTLVGTSTNNGLNGGAGNDKLGGNAGNDYMLGGPGNDVLRGGHGNDCVSGGPGNDTFIFGEQIVAGNRDTMPDYAPAYDRFQLDNAVFTLLGAVGPLNAALFRVAAHALDGNDRIVYDRGAGTLSYDVNGSAGGGSTVFATLTNKTVLTAAEFFVI